MCCVVILFYVIGLDQELTIKDIIAEIKENFHIKNSYDGNSSL